MSSVNRAGREDDGRSPTQDDVRQLLDPDDDRSSLIEQGRVFVSAGQVLANVRHRMERIDLDPATTWTLEEVMTLDEMAVMFDQLRQGPLVMAETAENARQILARWPADPVAHPIPSEARIEAFVAGIDLEPAGQDLGRRILNRALASPTEIEIDGHPELQDATPQELMSAWAALLFWFAIKSGLLHDRYGNS